MENDFLFLDILYNTESDHDYSLYKRMCEEVSGRVENPQEFILERYSFGGESFWSEISMDDSISEEFIEKHAEDIDWSSLCSDRTIDEDFITRFNEYIDWDAIPLNDGIPNELMEKYCDEMLVNCTKLMEYRVMPDDFIWEHRYRAPWYWICEFHVLNYDQMERFGDFLEWKIIAKKYAIPENLMLKYCGKMGLDFLTENQELSENFMRLKKKDLDWSKVCMCQNLSERFIEEMIDELNWYDISRHQSMSIDFIKKFHRYIDEEELLQNDKVSEEAKRIFSEISG